MASNVVFDVIARDRASRTFATVGGSANKLTGRFGLMGKAIGLVGVAAGGLIIFQKVTRFFGEAIAEAREAEKVMADTRQVLRTTGAAAGVTASEVGDLAEKISNLAGVDDEAVQSTENLLLTFTKVRNEVGKGSKIFDRATQAIVDMTARMNQGKITTEGMKAATIQVGKALNDPIKGLTALARAGVTFDEGQKKRIKRFVEEGNTLAAQKIILAELEKEFGGAAAAMADPADRAKVAWLNFQEAVGSKVLPTVNELLASLSGSSGLQKITDWVKKLKPEDIARFFAIGAKAVLNFARVGTLALQGYAKAWLGFVETVLDGLDSMKFLLPKSWEEGIAKARRQLPGWRADVDHTFDDIIGAIDRGKDALDNLPKLVKLGGDITDLKDKLADAEARLKRTTDKERRAKIKGEINHLKTKLAEAQRRIKALRGKTINIGANTSGARKKLKAIKGLIASVKGKKVVITVEAKSISGDLGDILGRGTKKEHGGPVRAGQAYIVGEKRPELFIPDRDGQILPNVPKVGRPHGGAPGADGGGRMTAEAFAEALVRRMIRAGMVLVPNDPDRAIGRRADLFARG